nr:OmpA family protein [Leptolyngbyaceae cyanobacterium MAG.088]
DLAQYKNATILIGSHTDDQLEPSQSRALAFQQANTLRSYLAGNLPDHRWVTVGYGQSRPITDNSTPQFRQRNRRIEIAIDRR